MNYTYEIARISPKQNFMRVIYKVDGLDDVHQNFSPVTDFSVAGITAVIEERLPIVKAIFDRQAAAPEIPDLGDGYSNSGVYTPPVVEPPIPPTPAEILERVIMDVEAFAAEKVAEGVVWTDATGKNWLFRSDIAKQGRMAILESRAAAGTRSNTDRVSCKRVRDNGNLIRKYRRTTNAEILEIATAIEAHVQKCLEAEANTVEKMEAGDMTADFQTEFDAL